MKVKIDRNHCGVHQAGCDSCFGGRIAINFGYTTGTQGDMDLAGCVLEVLDEEKKDEITFFIKDRDGSDKTLIVDKENWPDAYESWLDLYDKEMGAST